MNARQPIRAVYGSAVCRAAPRLIALLWLSVSSPAFGQQPTGGRLSAADAADFLGTWSLELESSRGGITGVLAITDVDGQVAAELDAQFGGSDGPITDISKTDQGLSLRYKANLGGRGLGIMLVVRRTGEELVGRLSLAAGQFSMDARASRISAEAARQISRESRGRGRFPRRTTQARVRLAGSDIRIVFGATAVRHSDFERIESLSEGEVISFSEAIATKLLTSATLRFGDVLVTAGNVAEDYPGVYSLWLKKTGHGWRLVFNGEADVWGTMHNPAADIVEVPLQRSESKAAAERYLVELKGKDRIGLIRIAWGPHVWQTLFSVPRE